MTVLSFNLKYCRYEINSITREVRTVFPDGRVAVGSRDETSGENFRQAYSEGYGHVGREMIWVSLVEHELLHNLVAEVLFDRPSVVMQVESGGEFVPLWQRYEEEMLVLCLQCKINKLEYPSPLKLYDDVYLYDLHHVVQRMKDYYRPQLAQLYA